jgi:CheY-like chemotaxis protein
MVEQLPGKRVLVVEDNAVIALDIDDVLRDFGVDVVGPALDLETGLQLASHQPLDGAVLDIDLGGNFVWPIAAALKTDRVPFVFVSADCGEELPRDFSDSICLPKPASSWTIASAVAQVITAG